MIHTHTHTHTHTPAQQGCFRGAGRRLTHWRWRPSLLLQCLLQQMHVIWGGGYMHVIWGGGCMPIAANACDMRRRIHTCMWYEEEDTCLLQQMHVIWGGGYMHVIWGGGYMPIAANASTVCLNDVAALYETWGTHWKYIGNTLGTHTWMMSLLCTRPEEHMRNTHLNDVAALQYI